MSVYSTLFFLGNLSPSFPVLYTVPANYVVVVRDVEIANNSGGSVTASIYASVSGLNAYLIQQTGLANQSAYQWKGRVVVPAGGTLTGYSSSSSNVTGIVSGYLLQ